MKLIQLFLNLFFYKRWRDGVCGQLFTMSEQYFLICWFNNFNFRMNFDLLCFGFEWNLKVIDSFDGVAFLVHWIFGFLK